MKRLLTTLFVASFTMSCSKPKPLTEIEKTQFIELDQKAEQLLRDFNYNTNKEEFVKKYCELVKDLDIDRFSIYLKEYGEGTKEQKEKNIAQFKLATETKC